MNKSVVDFVRGLRASGVRVSVAEATDGLHAISALGIGDKALFRSALRTTLIKRSLDLPLFDRLFPLYFESADAPLADATEDLSPDEQAMLSEALGAFDERVQRLLDWVMGGEGVSAEALNEMAQNMGGNWADSDSAGMWITRSMLRQLGFNQLSGKLAALFQHLSRRRQAH